MGIIYLFGRLQPRAFMSAFKLNYLIALANSDPDPRYFYVKAQPLMKIIEDVLNKITDLVRR